MIDKKKHTGSYYTPNYLASFISKRVLSYFDNRHRISVLEPSVGDGSFIEELNKSSISINITGVDINENELKRAKSKWQGKHSRFINEDFLEYNTKKKFSLIIGNPPYVKKSLLKKKQIEISRQIHFSEGLSDVSVKNIWTSFLIKSNKLLTTSGVLAFVLPSELLQVKYTEEIREYLKNEFKRIEIFTFDDLMFECKGQDTIVLIAYKKHIEGGEFFTNINNIEKLENNIFQLTNKTLLVQSKVKWTHHFLSNEELEFLYRLSSSLNKINFFTESKPGIVTAANNYFIINKETEEEYNLSQYTIPIVQKGLFVNGNVLFNDKDLKNIEVKYPSRLIQLKDSDNITDDLEKYLQKGIELNIPDRYKCSIRKKWYVIPNISTKPEAFFFKRSHFYPKLLKNKTNAFVTDSAYKINMKEGYDLDSFIFSFYNSLTLTFAEINGRYYGGGVLELTPKEFKSLPIPYIQIEENTFEDFVKRFEIKENIDDVLTINDNIILRDRLKLTTTEINKIEEIRRKLIIKRMRY